MNKKRVALYLGGVLLLTAVMAVSFYKNSEARTRTIATVAEAIPYFEQEQPAEQQKVKEEFSVSCGAEEEVVKSVAFSSQVLRIKFTDCPVYAKKSAFYVVKNLTNGYDAQVFKIQSQDSKSRMPANQSTQLSTDYIQLQSGENIIEFEISLNDGHKVIKKIRINRKSDESN
jgi:hypothetical protein